MAATTAALGSAWETVAGGGLFESGILATAGGLLFYVDGKGDFNAAAAGDGQILWSVRTGAVGSGPMTFELDGVQYIGLALPSRVVTFALPRR
jgi:glucose dehydrogenase